VFPLGLWPDTSINEVSVDLVVGNSESLLSREDNFDVVDHRMHLMILTSQNLREVRLQYC